MKEYYYKLDLSLEKYYAEDAEDSNVLVKNGYSAQFKRYGTCDFKWDDFEATFYHDGNKNDIVINGWTFSYRIKGRHRRYPVMDPDSPEFTIECLDPEKHSFRVRIDTFGFFKEAAADFMNSIYFISKFPNKDIASTYYTIKKWNKEITSAYDKIRYLKIDNNIDIIPLFEEIKTFYENHEEGADVRFLEELKETTNNAIECYKKAIDSLRI